MILPAKHLVPERALISVGADVLEVLRQPRTVSRTWEECKRLRERRGCGATITFDWFLLTLDLLFLMGALVLENGRLRRASQ